MRRPLFAFVLSLLTLSDVQAMQLVEVPGQFKPSDFNGHMITGTIRFDGDTIHFGGGGQRSFVRRIQKMGDWGPRSSLNADILELDGTDQPIKDGKFLCSENRPAKFLVLYSHGENMFMQSFSGSEEPNSFLSEGACEHFLYTFPDNFDPAQVVREMSHQSRMSETTETQRRATQSQMSVEAQRQKADRQAGTVGKWRVRRTKDLLTDKPKMVVRLDAASHDLRTAQTPELLLMCSDGKLSAYVDWQEFIGKRPGQQKGINSVTYRFDNDNAQTSDWDLSTDDTATFYKGSVGGFIRKLSSTETFIARVTPYRQSDVTVVFQPHGLLASVDELFEMCGLRF